MSTIQIDRLLDTVIRQGASDLHLSVGRKPTLRLHGGLRNLDTKVLDSVWRFSDSGATFHLFYA